MPSRVTSKGQVTIPKPVRDRLGIKPGNLVTFEMAPDGNIIFLKVGRKKPKSRFAALIGSADTGMTTDEIMALMRGDD